MRFFIELSYKGSSFHGWQVQENAHTVQAELNSALSTLLGSPIETLGAGRTDTGVHARQFFAQFDFEKNLPDSLEHHLNGVLPNDISIKRIFQVRNNVNARFDAVSRTYEYWVYRYKNPFLKDLACFFPYDVNIQEMNRAASLLMEYEDFSCFSKSNTQVKTNLCTVSKAIWMIHNDDALGNKLVFEITANRFLRNMVRAIAGTLLMLGRGEINYDRFRSIIESKNRSEAGFSVPACGLYLTQVDYNWNQILES